MEPVLKINIVKLFHHKRILCQNIELLVNKGERILIVGATGTGKSSLLSTLNLMNQSYEGSIHFLGKDIRHYKPEELRRRICIVMQEPWLDEGTIQENLDYPWQLATHKNRDKSRRDKLVRSLMDDFAIPLNFLKQDASKLSGGEKQRIALIRALQLEPELLLLDEISSALDQKTSGIISDCIFNSFSGTVIAISHDPLWQSRWQRTWEIADTKLHDTAQTRGV